MTVFSRRGACPALSAPMQTGDGLLVRLNPITQGLPPKTLIGLCKSALRHGNGIIEVTARGSVQIRGLTETSAPLLAEEVDALGISVRTGVPVETGPLAGLDPSETADPTPLAESIRAAITERDLSERLGPKVSVVVDGGGQFGMDSVQADIRLTADGDIWQLSIAGDAGTATFLRSVSTEDAPTAAISILESIAERGRDARARDLISQNVLGILTNGPSSPCRDLLPACGEKNEAQASRTTSFSPPAGRRSRQGDEGQIAKLGIVDLGTQAHALSIALPYGSVTAETLIAICDAAAKHGASEIRPALQRRLLILGLSTNTCATLQTESATLGFITDASDPRRSIAACPGAPACASGQIETREIAERIAEQSGDVLDPSVTLHISGCAKGCAHPASSALTIVGGENGAGFVVCGTAKGLPASYTPRYEPADGFGRVAKLIRMQRSAGETTVATLAKIGAARLAAAFRQG
ncbi:precorrin-3B synthase [Mesorhizobium sp. SB112]|uniref:precorrin-3B synthase n=1 Tax=Mesorhizobium sp. SB112 TaxID=3151853 RepID=UPI0032660C7B